MPWDGWQASAGMDAEVYRRWRAFARRLVRTPDEADDIVQDGLLAAVAAGRAGLTSEADRRWFSGVIRNQALMLARSTARRRQREAACASPVASDDGDPDHETARAALDRLPRGVRQVATLALHGLAREEVAVALGLSDAAFRQRLTALRRCLEQLPEHARAALLDQPIAEGRAQESRAAGYNHRFVLPE